MQEIQEKINNKNKKSEYSDDQLEIYSEQLEAYKNFTSTRNCKKYH